MSPACFCIVTQQLRWKIKVKEWTVGLIIHLCRFMNENQLRECSGATACRWAIHRKCVCHIDSWRQPALPEVDPEVEEENGHTAKWPSAGAGDPVSGAPSVPQFLSANIKDNWTWWKLHQTQGFHSEAARLALFPGQSRGAKPICQTI